MWSSSSQCLGPSVKALEDQDHGDPGDISHPGDGYVEIPKACLIEDRESHVWMVLGVIEPGELLPAEGTKSSLFLKRCWLSYWGKIFFVPLVFCVVLCLVFLCI